MTADGNQVNARLWPDQRYTTAVLLQAIYGTRSVATIR